MEEDFARVKVVMNEEFGERAARRAGEGYCQGKGAGEGVGDEGEKAVAGNAGAELRNVNYFTESKTFKPDFPLHKFATILAFDLNQTKKN